MRQPDLFAPAPARVVLDGPALRDKGHQRVAHADPDASLWLTHCLDQVCAQRHYVTSDDLHVYLDAQGTPGSPILRRPALIGATIRAAAVAGKLRDTGRCIKTQRVAGQGRKITVWEVVR